MKGLRSQPGFTLIEVLVGMAIGTIVVLVSFSFMQTGARGYERAVEGLSERQTAQTAFDILRCDLDRRYMNFPLSLGIGSDDTGFTFANGGVLDWEVGYGTRFPSEAQTGFPSDRIGFFITISEQKAEKYNGLRIAHVLYFTAITSNASPENLTQAKDMAQRGYSRKLFRLFTPPDRVYERLKLLDPITAKGNAVLPSGLGYSSSGVLADDADWGIEANDAVISLVASNVAQFSIAMDVQVTEGDNIASQAVSPELLVTHASQLSVHDLLIMEEPLAPVLSPSAVEFTLQLCPHQISSTLTVEEWDKRLDGLFLGREGIRPIEFSMTSFF